MKSRFSSYDVICSIAELQKLWNLRVNQVYDIDHKTYLIKFQDGETKVFLLFESGIRIHTTSFEWPKNTIPSGFCMKLRKHIKNKRLKTISQVGVDRIVDMQFGTGEAAYHVILELYDKGNIILTDFNYIIINILRPHTEGEEVRFAVREKYPSDRGKERTIIPSEQEIENILKMSKPDDTLKKILNPHLVYGSAVLDHVLLRQKFPINVKLKNINLIEDMPKLLKAFADAEKIIHDARMTSSKGFIIQKKEKRINNECNFYTYQEFHPFLFDQHLKEPYLIFDTFNQAVDEFFSKLENQKIEMKGVQQERAAMKKLENVRKDHEKRIYNLEQLQTEDKIKAELITRNQKLVDRAITAIRQLLANKMSWDDIDLLIKEAALRNDEVARIIKKLKLNINNITLLLLDPYNDVDNSNDEDGIQLKPTLVDIDLDFTAFANAKRYYDQKRQAVTKQMKTIESEGKALKSAERKTKQTLKEVKTSVTISKARKVYWFEKFYWFISSENYLVIGGRDQQQNELIVKRYLKRTDIYVHAGTTGASSVIIKNPTDDPVPPKTLNEAGTMAICYSTAWEAKVVTSAWWVYANQVSKTAPTGEYLTTGSFIIRGKKNFLPQSNLVMGFSFLFRLEESSVDRHKFERRKKTLEQEDKKDEDKDNDEADNDFVECKNSNDDELEISLSDVDESDNDNNQDRLESVPEEMEEKSYPDTEIVIEHTGNEYNVKVKHNEENHINKGKQEANEHDSETEAVFYLGDDKPVIIKTNIRNRKNSAKKENENIFRRDTIKNEIKHVENDDQSKRQNIQLKRGQKGKLKKINRKYKDQDEEERRLRMAVLQSAGSEKEKKKKKKDKNNNNNKNTKNTIINQTKQHQVNLNSTNTPSLIMIDSSKVDIENQNESDEDAEHETVNEPLVTADVDMLDSLTGQPLSEDELLFAIPVVAPYSVLTNYKYKVKLTPGPGKRGKASKMSLSLFLKDKAATQKEKDLLKFVKDQDLARNIPGKVKLSAPQLSKHKM